MDVEKIVKVWERWDAKPGDKVRAFAWSDATKELAEELCMPMLFVDEFLAAGRRDNKERGDIIDELMERSKRSSEDS